MALTNLQVTEAQALREGEEDLTWKEIAKRIGLKEAQAPMVRTAVEEAQGRPPATSERVAELMAKQSAKVEQYKNLRPEDDDDVMAARADRIISEEEAQELIMMYRANAKLPPDEEITFEEMGKALEPPVHWLTVQDAIGSRGWASPTKWYPPFSTATPEGKAELRRWRAEGLAG